MLSGANAISFLLLSQRHVQCVSFRIHIELQVLLQERLKLLVSPNWKRHQMLRIALATPASPVALPYGFRLDPNQSRTGLFALSSELA